MNNKLTCHPDLPESGQQVNRQANIDTCRTCLTCKHFSPTRCGFGMCYLLPTMFSQTTESSEACEDYEPADQ